MTFSVVLSPGGNSDGIKSTNKLLLSIFTFFNRTLRVPRLQISKNNVLSRQSGYLSLSEHGVDISKKTGWPDGSSGKTVSYV